MRFILLYFTLMVLSVNLSGQVVILDFEAPETSTLFNYFGSSLDGTQNEVIANPNPTGVNTSDSVAVHIRPAGSETFAGAFAGSPMMIEATAGGEVCIDVHMDHMGSVGFKLENGDGAQNWTIFKNNTVMNEWETICFQFDSLSQDQTTIPATGNTYSTIVIFFDFGTVGDVDMTNYFDNIVLNPGEAATTIVDIVVGSEDHDTLEAAVIAADLAGTLSGAGPFTLFAPTDAAFADLPAGTIEALLADPMGDLTDILLYHVLDSKVLSGDIADGETVVPTLNGASITITKNADGVFVNGAQVTVPDLEADNGVVHVINGVLLPPDDPVSDDIVILDFETPETSTLFNYFGSSLDGTQNEVIANPNPTGVNTSDSVAVHIRPAGSETFAGAFAGSPMMIEATAGGEVCMDVHMDHMGNVGFKLENGDGAQNWTLFRDNTVMNDWETLCFPFDSLSQDQTTIPATGNTYSTIVIFFDFGTVGDVDMTNYFDNIIVKPGEEVEMTTIVDIVVESEDHDTLEAAVIAADLAGTLSGPGPFTLFAPTDAAFAELPAGTIEALLADPMGDLTDILLYHVLDSKVLSGDIAEGETVVPTLNGKDITITKNADGVFVNGAQVTVPDLEADNGVVHVIDAVLLPPDDPTPTDQVILDFEAPETSTLFQYFGGSNQDEFNMVIANPNPTGVNTSDSVAVLIKPANSEVWAGAFSNPNPTNVINATEGGEVCVDVHMDHIGNFTLKLEQSTDGGPDWIATLPNTVENDWETLCFDLSTPAFEGTMEPADGFTYARVTVFFDFGTAFTMDVTNYFDNVVYKTDATSNVEEIPVADLDIQLIPNVTKDVAKLIFNEAGQKRMQIFTANGTLVQSVNIPEFDQERLIDVSGWANGLYYIKINMEQGQTTKRLIVAK